MLFQIGKISSTRKIYHRILLEESVVYECSAPHNGQINLAALENHKTIFGACAGQVRIQRLDPGIVRPRCERWQAQTGTLPIARGFGGRQDRCPVSSMDGYSQGSGPALGRDEDRII